MEFLTANNIISAYGTISEGDGRRFEEELSKISSTHKTIRIRLHTYGGNVFEGNQMCNALANCSANVELQVVGVAASMGAILTLYAKNVSIVENGFLMFHAPHSNTHGTAQEHEATSQLLRSIEANFIQKLIQKTHKSKQELQLWLRADTWFNAQQALQAGLVSGIIEAEIETQELDPYASGLKQIYAQFETLFNTQKTTKMNENKQNNMNDNIQEQGIAFEVQNELRAYKQKCQDLQLQLDAMKKQSVDELIQRAKKTKQLSPNVEDTLRQIAHDSGLDTLKVVIETMPERRSLFARIRGNDHSERLNWNFEDWQKNDPRGLEKRAKEDPQWFEELLKN